jgi:hypothetical protein
MRSLSGRIAPFACAGLVAAFSAAQAQTTAAPQIYRCTGADGKPRRADRPMTDCSGEQYQMNPDGSIYRVVPRPLTEEEREEVERKQREEEAARRAQQVEARADLALLKRYPDKAAHDLARKEALDSARADIRASDARIAELLRARKPLIDETEFYVNKPLPLKLKLALDTNDALLAAQRSLRQNKEDEVQRIDKIYDDELAHLMKLWAVKAAH